MYSTKASAIVTCQEMAVLFPDSVALELNMLVRSGDVSISLHEMQWKLTAGNERVPGSIWTLL